jgi:hypothetical protein
MKRLLIASLFIVGSQTAMAEDIQFNNFSDNTMTSTSYDLMSNYSGQPTGQASDENGGYSASEKADYDYKIQEQIILMQAEKENAKNFKSELKDIDVINYLKRSAGENGYKLQVNLDKIYTINNNSDFDELQIASLQDDYQKQQDWRTNFVLALKILNNVNYMTKLDKDYIVPVVDESTKTIYVTHQYNVAGMRGKVMDIFENDAIYKGYKTDLPEGYTYEKDGKKYQVKNGLLNEVDTKTEAK